MVLAMWLQVQRRPFRQVECLWLPWHAVFGYIQVSSGNRCTYHTLSHPIHPRIQAYPHSDEVIQESSLLP